MQCAYVARFMQSPQHEHWVAVKRIILRYLQGTRNYSVHYGNKSGFDLCGYSDADWVDTSDRVFLLAAGANSWGSKKQSSVALSTSEAEYIALKQVSSVVCMCMFAFHFLFFQL
jgi:hypothetical protein